MCVCVCFLNQEGAKKNLYLFFACVKLKSCQEGETHFWKHFLVCVAFLWYKNESYKKKCWPWLKNRWKKVKKS